MLLVEPLHNQVNGFKRQMDDGGIDILMDLILQTIGN